VALQQVVLQQVVLQQVVLRWRRVLRQVVPRVGVRPQVPALQALRLVAVSLPPLLLQVLLLVDLGPVLLG